MATQSETRQFFQAIEASRDAIVEDVKQVAFDNLPAVSLFYGHTMDEMMGARLAGENFQRELEGGGTIEFKVDIEQANKAQALASQWGSLDVTPASTVKHGRQNWRHLSNTIVISETERLTNRGSNKIFDIVQQRTEHAINDLADFVGGIIYDGSASSAYPDGLEQVISANDSIAGLSGATYPKWNSRGVSARGTAASSVSFASTTGSFSQSGRSDLIIAQDNATEGRLVPSVFLTTHAVYRFLELSLLSNEQYVMTGRDGAPLGDPRFRALEFGGAAVHRDPKCTSGVVYMVQPAGVKVYTLKDANMGTTEFIPSQKQETHVSQVLLKTNMVPFNRKLLNKVTGLAA